MGGGGEEICFEGMRGDGSAAKLRETVALRLIFKTNYKDGKVSDIDKEYEPSAGGGGLDGEG